MTPKSYLHCECQRRFRPLITAHNHLIEASSNRPIDGRTLTSPGISHKQTLWLALEKTISHIADFRIAAFLSNQHEKTKLGTNNDNLLMGLQKRGTAGAGENPIFALGEANMKNPDP